MTKYTLASRRRSTVRHDQTHAIWRGIGCVLVVIIPLMSWLLAALTVQAAVAGHWPMPYQLMGNPRMPDLLWKVPGLGSILAFLERQPNLFAIMAITVVYVVVAGAIMSVAYAILYRFVGPPRYGPLDAPPPKVNVGRYRR